MHSIKDIITRIVNQNPYDGILFSGGLDSSIVAALSPTAIGITVTLGRHAEDTPYAHLLAKTIGMKQHRRSVSIDEAIANIPKVIKILKSFDPALPNDLAAYFGLETAKQLGLRRVATGDGSDELFGGYSFMAEIKDLNGYIAHVAKKMHFSSNDIGKYFHLKIVQPFFDQRVINCALAIPANLKIKKVKGKNWGKWILRKQFSDLLPKKIAWQSKRPLEVGSGMTKLRNILSAQISDQEFAANPYPVKFFNKEHFYYYKVYRKVIGEIPRPRSGEKSCQGCGAGMDRNHFHCKVCGHVLPMLERYGLK
ncbi:MAG: hypothetical protein A3G33_04360 [Omnitrophica bacterium RIFCSPLOWO2_12_FULL_44_17]|uniref:Asparagine synthetase domain-containing protein n=1 Tax=Candidatus Danuiimicrobium aquiferis TaxID=1801832 RepID=A0A1G1KQJ3_9BACT|nr:MAG: hypothetical protein A3B72_10570 [Omnitrophica bacterium RIFCSPHIGHO2_02_FULL_45_28]OGW92458.1 MAG: hypothetical protein A3E74_03885 [Omnitrophica bacterium RIFCSPHIGHO2_12_FULL_44_12]OGW95168.1 MAG: hypothetical protein A3G33_04360 [Omnitrophica bacterium RIFCSPLOWO2_12_FULL_44_17]OGX01687.1 MAG: hypothetical protein A3J12_04075 [Omnitrophica bacterium RIFCSPLOWO2_02_FULL_44_11]